MAQCPACHEVRPAHEMRPPHSVVPRLVRQIERRKPGWSPDQAVCQHCINEAMADDAETVLQEDMGLELTELERAVIESLRRGASAGQNLALLDEPASLTRAERIADFFANMVGTLRFPALLLLLLGLWLLYGAATGMVERQPVIFFGGLSSTLGTLAAIQNPIILMAQRRQARRDRLRSQNDYRVNLKSELEVRYLNAKLDYLLETVLAERGAHHSNTDPQ